MIADNRAVNYTHGTRARGRERGGGTPTHTFGRVKGNELQVGRERGRIGVRGDQHRNAPALLLPPLPLTGPPPRLSPLLPPAAAAPTGCPRGSPLREHHVTTTLTPASPRP